MIFPALFAPLTIVLDSVLWEVQSRDNLLYAVFRIKTWGFFRICRGKKQLSPVYIYVAQLIFQTAVWFTDEINLQWCLVSWACCFKVVPQTWSQCSSPFALEGLVEVLFVLQQMRRSWRWTVDSGSSAGASWRSPPSLSSLPHQKPLLSTVRGISQTTDLYNQQYLIWIFQH